MKYYCKNCSKEFNNEKESENVECLEGKKHILKKKALDKLTDASSAFKDNSQKIETAASNFASAIKGLKAANESLGNPMGKGIGFISEKISKKSKDEQKTDNAVNESAQQEVVGAENQSEANSLNTSGQSLETKKEGINAKQVFSVIFMVVSVIYAISPIDLSPDAIPVVGWLDDIGLILTSGVNALQQFAKNQESFMVKILKYIKWFMVIAIVIAAILFGGLIAAIVALVVK
jgi:DNA-directed RNA polymerase subunit RPC12/RpoP